jgi:hypothetical protein
VSTSTIFDDNFASYTPGTDQINGFYDAGFFKGEVVAFSTMTGSSPAPGFYEQTGQGYLVNFGGVLSHEETTAQASTQIVWAGFSNSTPVIALNNANLSTGTGSLVNGSIPVCGMVVNSDFTISLTIASTNGANPYAGGVIIATTEEQAAFFQVWQYYQLNFAFSAVPIGTLSYLVVTGTLAIDGIQRCVGTGTTNIQPSSLYTGQANINQWQFVSQGGGWITNITGIVGSPLPAFSVWPHPVTPLEALYTQSVAEPVKKQSSLTRPGRVTQGVVEPVKRPAPLTRQARVTQGVVEVILRRLPGGGWYIYEA